MSSHHAGQHGLDLPRSLADLAASVHDDALTARLTRQVGPMVTRVRRRRAARAGAAAATAVGTVACVAVAAMALGGGGVVGPAPVPPASQAPTAQGADGAVDLTCGAQVAQDDLRPHVSGLEITSLRLRDAEAASAEALGVGVRLRNDDAAPVTGDVPVRVAVVADGAVVATGTLTWHDVALAPGGERGVEEEVTLEACDGSALTPGGAFALAVAVSVPLPGGTAAHLSAGLLPFTVAESPGGATAEQRAALDAILDAAPVDAPFGACGTRVPQIPADAPLSLEIDLDDGSGLTVTPGGEIEAITVLWAGEGLRRVVAEVPVDGATVVLARDGVVVGRSAPGGGETAALPVGASDPQVMWGSGAALLCSLPGADGPALPLPPGTYQAYAVLEVRVTQVVREDGTTEARDDVLVVRSEPLDLTVLAPAR
jgi:hypothetical protein